VTPAGGEDRSAAAAWIRHELPRLAPAWLVGQRWFGGKARRIARVRIDDVLWLGDGLEALVILDVAYAAGGAAAPDDQRYAIVAAVRGDDAVGAVIGRLPERSWTVVDAPGDPRALAALLAGLAGDAAEVRGARGGRLAYADATERARALTGAGSAPEVAPLAADQSNTSVRIGSSHVFKLFRRLDDGVHPQLEVSRQLAARRFTATPPLEGSVVYRRDPGLERAIGALEGWVENSGDGWRYVVGQLAAATPGSPAAAQLSADLARLGAITAEFHLALAADATSPDFAPEPVSAADLRRWSDELDAQAAATFDLVARAHGEWPQGESLAAAIVEGRPHVAEMLQRAGGVGVGGFHRIRIHGDYHLGQVLKTADGFAIVDFEGEPSKALAQRRQKHCALKDAAGMLRSFDYAAASAARAGADRSATTAWMRHAFLDAYLGRAREAGAVFLPGDEAATSALIDRFEMEKALYEVEYEANNRPDWVHIPLSAVAGLLQRAGASRPRSGVWHGPRGVG
jgi:maltose alpha-D-glucosyltransferase/alpha-amylase